MREYRPRIVDEILKISLRQKEQLLLKDPMVRKNDDGNADCS